MVSAGLHRPQEGVPASHCWCVFLPNDAFHANLCFDLGFDLVGDENVLHPLKYYAEVLLRFPAMQEAAGLPEDQRIPFIFHAGETLGDGSEPDDNLYDAVLLGTKRIGHGYASYSIIKRRFSQLAGAQLLDR